MSGPLQAPPPEPEPRWYALQAQSSKENRVQQLLEHLVEDERIDAEEEGREPEIFNAIVPTYETTQIRHGKRMEVTKRRYPGYVLVELMTHFRGEVEKLDESGETVLDANGEVQTEKIGPYLRDYTLHTVTSVNGVLRFVGPQPLRPRPLEEAEMNSILGISDEETEKRDKVPFWPGQPVEVTDGPFKEFNGVVEEVDHDKGRVRVEVSIFGRPTTVDLEYTQLKA